MDKSLMKGLRILEEVARSGRPRGVTELSVDLGLTKSGTHRLLQTLVAADLLRQDSERRMYSAGLKLWELGMQVLAQLDIRDIASPYLLALARRTRESVNLAILDGTHVVFIDRIEDGQHVRSGYVGVRAPAHALSTGKVLLAHADERVISQACVRPQGFTPSTITSARLLRSELAEVRKRGYAFNVGEWRDLVNSVAVPIWDTHGQLVAAMGLTGPTSRMTLKRMSDFVPLMHATAQSIGHRLADSSARHPRS
jgi:IclR family transcriptional regulator, KDG regulon repressor